MTKEEIIARINALDLRDFDWNEDVYTDGEIEYQIRTHLNGDFRSILVRFCDDNTHTYREFFENDYEDSIEDLIYDAFSETTIDILTESIMKRVK